MDKPDVDYIEGLSPAISIDQKTTSHNPRSTVGTVTEIHDYLRLLYARIGVPHCPACGREIPVIRIDQMVDQVMSMGEGTRLNVLAPVVRARKGEYVKLLEDIAKNGYVRVRVDGQVMEIRRRNQAGKTEARHRRGGGPHRGAAGRGGSAGRVYGDRAGGRETGRLRMRSVTAVEAPVQPRLRLSGLRHQRGER